MDHALIYHFLPEASEMIHYQQYGFQGALEKNFNREKIKAVLEQVLER